MRKTLCAFAVLACMTPWAASAQVDGVNLNGRYTCIAACLTPPGSPAFVTQYGWQLNVINEAGLPSRAWVDYPGHIWVDQANQGAIYSPDGIRIQFDSGTIWQRTPDVVLVPRRRLR
jgi:hypothetical protein